MQGVNADFFQRKVMHSSHCWEITDISSRLEVFYKIAVRKTFAKLKGRRLCPNLSEFPRTEISINTLQYLAGLATNQLNQNWQFPTFFLEKYSSI